MPAARPPPKKRRPQAKRLVFKPPAERLKLPSVEKIIEDPSDPHSSLRAAQEGDLGRLADLGNAGWDFPRVRDRNGCGLVHRAAGNGHAAALEYLIHMGCDAADPGAGGRATKRGRTPLHFAARHGHMACCRLLIARGAPVNAETHSGVTPLMWAAFYGQPEAIDFLVLCGAAPDYMNHKTGCTAAHWCGAGGSVAAAEALLECGVDFTEANDVGHTPLNKAAAKGEADMVEWLLDVVPPTNVLLKDRTGRTAADAAADAGFPHLAGALWEFEGRTKKAMPWLDFLELESSR